MTTLLEKTEIAPGLEVGTWKIDPAHSEAAFVVRHAGISKVRGTVDITEGLIVVGESWENSNVQVSLDAGSVTTRDEGRDRHLRSSDFFDVENAPTWRFESKRLEGEGDRARIVGELSLKGLTRTVVLDADFNGVAVDPYGQKRAGFSARTEISRKDFDLTWNAALESGGLLVGEKVKIEIEVSAIKA